jgi:outer membrane receptor protein involved in Fe transport
MSATSLAVFAQDDADEEKAQLDRVTVTGSRISRSDVEGVAPVLTITRDELVASGHNTLQDYVRTLTVAQANNGDDYNNSFANGTSTINLRGLGGNATLLLLNSRRISPYGSGQNITEAFVDLNSIPFSAIERIEILKDGASAIYGADAVAGVVNVILRRDYVGAEYEVGYQSDADGDAPQTSASVVFGGDAGRTSWTTIFSYLSREALFYRDREFSNSARGGPIQDNRSSAGWPGTIFDPGPDPDDGGADDAIYPAPGCGTLPGTPFDSGPLGSLCRFNYNQFINFYPKSERFGITNFLSHEITDNVDLYWDTVLNYTNTRNTAAAAPFFGPYTGSQDPVPDGLPPDMDFWLLGGLHLYFPASNPNNPIGRDVALRHRGIGLGERIGDIMNHQFWTNVGAEGFIGDSLWDYDVGMTFSQSKVLIENRNSQNAFKMQQYLIGAPDPSGSGEMLYYNPFSLEQDPRVANEISFTYENRNQFEELTFYGTVTGPLFELGGTEVGAAFGLEYREQDMANEADPLRNAGGIIGTGRASDTFGYRDVFSAFVELAIPIGPVEIQAALRYEDYSDFGDTTKPKLGAKWRITDSLLLRAAYSESFRAPSLFELFGGIVSSFPSGLIDGARCPSPGSGPGVGGNAPDLTPVDCGEGQHQVDNGGNPLLQPEEADTMSFGFVWEPTADLYFQVDYWSYKYENLITQLGNQTILNLNDPNFVIRSSPGNGQVLKILNSYINGAKYETDGIDFYATWSFDALGGEIRLSNEMTYTMNLEFTTFAGTTLEGVGGRVLGDVPEIKDNFVAAYTNGDHNFQALVHYRSGIENHFSNMDTGGLADRCPFSETLDPGFSGCDTESHTTLDLSYTYNLPSNASIQVGCINCTDEDPVLSYFAGGNDTGGYFTSLDDPRGLVWFARWRQEF